jgi:hypothetical protein
LKNVAVSDKISVTCKESKILVTRRDSYFFLKCLYQSSKVIGHVLGVRKVIGHALGVRKVIGHALGVKKVIGHVLGVRKVIGHGPLTRDRSLS